METELKPCPFCGGEAGMVPPDSALPLWYAGCRHCDQGFCEDSEAEAIAAWNARADDNRMCEDCAYFGQCETLKAMGAAGLPVSYDAWYCADFTKRGSDGRN
jgi:Lar family restriction alleviation protein